MKLLVTGATGKFGSKVVETLLKTVPASQLAVSVRNPEKAEALRARGKGILIIRKHWMLLLQALIVYCLFPRMGITKQEFVSTPMQWLRQNARASGSSRTPV